MAVKPEQIKARLKVLFPKANLSTKRTDEISARLSKKPADDADEAAIDEVINDYNENGAMTFEEIAKADDKIRTLEANKPTSKPDDKPAPDPDETPTEKALRLIMDKLEKQDQRFAELDKSNIGKSRKEIASARLTKIPKDIKEDLLADIDNMNFADEDAFNSFLDRKEVTFKTLAERNKLEGFNGDDTPASGEASETAKGKVKPIDMEMAKKIVS